MSSAYQVIARKWRPRTFADVVGQDHVVRTLRNAIGRQRIAHAYLFVGPRGTGKTSTARIFAKALNCTGGPNADFDPADPACIAIAEGSHLDVIEIDGASNNGVDQVRDLRETVRYAPAQGRFKVYIIDEVHMLSAAAFNALLKTLEEPPAHVKFIFATTDPQKVLPTIVSRCQRFDLKPIPEELIVTRLQLISTAEGIQADPAALACIARLADGGMRDAQSILDQMISFCGTTVTEPDVLEVYGLVSAAQVAELAGAVATGDQRRIVALVDACDAAGRDLVRLLTDLQAVFRTALLDAIARGGRSEQLGGIALTTEQLTRLLDALREGEGGVKLGLAEKINFEVTLLRAVEASRARAIDSLLKELTALAEEAPAADEKKKGLIDQLEARLASASAARAAALPLPVATPDSSVPVAALSPPPAGAPPSAEISPSGEATPSGEPEAVWPDESAEAQFLGEARERGESVPAPPTPAAEPEAPEAEPAGPAPELDALVGRLPPAVRETLDELFRARFVRVTRLPRKTLAAGKG